MLYWPPAGDAEAVGLWERLRALSIDEYRRIYGQLHIEFDVYDGESQVRGLALAMPYQY
jgi:arginyl-tRNA synthetase